MTELLIFVVVLLILCLCAVIENTERGKAWADRMIERVLG